MRNPYKALLDLLPSSPLLVGDVVAVNGDVAVVELPGGGLVQARGQTVVGAHVFVRGGVIEGEAPALTYVSASV